MSTESKPKIIAEEKLSEDKGEIDKGKEEVDEESIDDKTNAAGVDNDKG